MMHHSHGRPVGRPEEVASRQEANDTIIRAADRIHFLSDREREVLGLLADGLSNQQIASRLHISVRTSKFHVSGILEKLRLRSRFQAGLAARLVTSPTENTESTDFD